MNVVKIQLVKKALKTHRWFQCCTLGPMDHLLHLAQYYKSTRKGHVWYRNCCMGYYSY